MSTGRQKDLETSFGLALNELKGKVLEEVAERSGASCGRGPKDKETLTLPCLGREAVIDREAGEVEWVGSRDEVPLWQKIIILHYLNTASGSPLKQQWITFNEIPSGAFYLSAFTKRVKMPLVDFFGPEPERLFEAARAYPHEVTDLGDVSVKIHVFPRLPVQIVLWRGDEEFAPEGNVLYDATVSEYLPTEDIALASQMLVYGLVKEVKGKRGQ